jgi:cation:H+ antiporter
MLNLDAFPVWANLLIFGIAAAVLWFGGVRLEQCVDIIAERKRIGHALAGSLLLAAATSLPEIVTVVSAALINNPTLAIYGLLGGVALRTAIIAISDGIMRDRGALTSFIPSFVLLFQGVGVIIIMQVAILGVLTKDPVSVFGVGLSPMLIVLVYLAMLFGTRRFETSPRWRPEGDGPQRTHTAITANQLHHLPTRVIYAALMGASLLILASGWVITHTADVLAVQTGLGSSFIGVTLIALATSLPEMSTTLSAAHKGHYSLAMSTIFGTNAFDASLLLLLDIVYVKGPALAQAGNDAVFSAALGALVTCIYLWGLLERSNRSFFGMGWDSWLVLLLYLGGTALLYFR